MLRAIVRKLFPKRIRLRNSRRYKRFRAHFLVKYQLSTKGETRITNAKDVSAGGLCFWSTERILESSLLRVSIYLPPLERTVDALVQVLRVRKVKKVLLYSVAVNFLDLDRKDREAINEFAESLSKDKGAKFLIDHAEIVVRK